MQISFVSFVKKPLCQLCVVKKIQVADAEGRSNL